ncbi:unnamed protein product [Linum tenue]|uniref:Ubiquitin-like domain-containing protein n=1 Tax=Linum tenue TaxID=586396 RepID=A0AAV0KAZ9_9ROSI|nr:unnamed protein product [Linum tenue]
MNGEQQKPHLLVSYLLVATWHLFFLPSAQQSFGPSARVSITRPTFQKLVRAKAHKSTRENRHGGRKNQNRRERNWGNRRPKSLLAGHRSAMVEIVEVDDVGYRSSRTAEFDNGSEKKKTKEANMVEITLKTIGPSPSSRLHIPSPVTVRDLRKLIAESKNLPAENLRLVLHGKMVEDGGDDDMLITLKNNDALIVAVKPKPPAKHLQDGCDDDDDLKFQLPQSTSPWKRKLYFFLRHKLKIPGKAPVVEFLHLNLPISDLSLFKMFFALLWADMLLAGLFSLSAKVWAAIILWFIFAPVANRWHLGPLYILGTGFAIIFLNLGRRQAGDVSAYSIFNEDFRELPGTLNADRLDRDIRAGQM